MSAIRLGIKLATGHFTRGVAGPVKLILETTRRCNSHCQTCDMWQHRPGPEIAPDDLLHAVETVGATVRWVAVTGGEVTLYPHLAYLVRGLAARCPKLSIINIPLNGINPERTAKLIAQLLQENPRIMFHITLSIDGIGQDQDELRGRGQWKQTVGSWEKLQEFRKSYKNLRVSAQTTVSRLNLAKAAEVMQRYAIESDSFIIAFAMENDFYRSSPASNSTLVNIATAKPAARSLELQASDLKNISAIVRHYRVSGLSTFVEKLFLRGMLRRLRVGSSGLPCVAGKQVVFISAKGEVRPCPFFDRSMGRLEETSFNLRALLDGPAAKDVRAAAEICDKCWNNCVGVPSLVASPMKALRLLGES